MTDSRHSGHEGIVNPSLDRQLPAVRFKEALGADAVSVGIAAEPVYRDVTPLPSFSVPSFSVPSFNDAYEQHFDLVWCGLRSLGVREAQLDDAAQDVFLVVHRRLGDFEGRSTLKTWIYGIVVRVAKDYRRREHRKGGLSPMDFEVADIGPGPEEHVDEAQSRRALRMLLEMLDEDKREVFVLAELEELTAPEIAETLQINLNTVYSRLRAARRDFEARVAQHGEKLR